MRKFTHIRESDFKETEFEYDDEIVEVASTLQKAALECFDNVLPVILTNESGSTLKFSVNMGKDKLERELGQHIYRITIEKI